MKRKESIGSENEAESTLKKSKPEDEGNNLQEEMLKENEIMTKGKVPDKKPYFQRLSPYDDKGLCGAPLVR